MLTDQSNSIESDQSIDQLNRYRINRSSYSLNIES